MGGTALECNSGFRSGRIFSPGPAFRFPCEVPRMPALILLGLSTLVLFALIYGKRPAGCCVRGCHGCGECSRKEKDAREELCS